MQEWLPLQVTLRSSPAPGESLTKQEQHLVAVVFGCYGKVGLQML